MNLLLHTGCTKAGYK